MSDHPSGVILVTAPTGRDAPLAVEVLEKAGVPARICPTLASLAAAIDENTGAVLVAEEALTSKEIDILMATLRAQEPWSDLPFLLLTRTDVERERSVATVAKLRPLTFVTLLERPFRAATLVACVEAVLRARRRQWEVRDLLAERTIAEHRIRESQEQLRLVIDHAAALVVYCDAEARYRFVNRQYSARFGVQPEEIIGKTIAEVVGARAYETVQSYVRQALDGHAVEFEEKIPYEKFGSRWTHCAYVPDKDEQGGVRGFVALITDVQARREAEEALREAKLQAEAASAAKDHFLATLSHELRTPLTPVLMCLADRVSDPTISAELREELSMIRRNVELEARLIDDLLDLTRVSRGKIELHLEVVDIHQVLKEALEVSTANDAVRRQILVSLETPAEAHHAQADRARLQQVFWNLINNALKFSPDGSQVIVRTTNPKPDCIAIEVIDHGFGIDPEKLPRLFEAFEQGGRSVTKRFGGLGLGLAISKALVQLHHGSIRAESEGKDRGAKFVVELDTCLAPAASSPGSETGKTNAVVRPLRVLLVEDHETTLTVLTRLLRRAGHEVVPASRVNEAREYLGSQKFDLMISDLGLPDGSGVDLMREMDGHALPSIALSGYGMDSDVRECLEAGFQSHVTKPVDWQRLSATIQQVTTER